MKILLYGNCQLFAIKNTLNLNSNHELTLIECWENKLDKDEFTKIINNSDIIITQPINENYRDVDYLSTNYLILNKNENCIIILFNSCYFNFYFFDLTYKIIDNKLLEIPCAYHYNKLIECYKNNKPIDEFIDNYLNNKELKTKEELEEIANESINELEKRFIEYDKKYTGINIHKISIVEYIKENYKKKLLFYSMNHPSKYVIQYICEKIINILNIENTINYNIDILNSPKCILYKCILNVVEFKINDELSFLKDYKNKKDYNNNYEIVKLYYDSYKELNINFN